MDWWRGAPRVADLLVDLADYRNRLDRLLAQRTARGASILLAFTAVAYCSDRRLARPDGSDGPWHFPPYCLRSWDWGCSQHCAAEFVFAALAEVSMFALLALLVMLTARVVSSDVERYARWARWFAFFCDCVRVGCRNTLSGGRQRRSRDRSRRIGPRLFEPTFSDCIARRIDPLPCADGGREEECISLRIAAAVILSFLWAINLGLGTRGIWFAYALAFPPQLY